MNTTDTTATTIETSTWSDELWASLPLDPQHIKYLRDRANGLDLVETRGLRSVGPDDIDGLLNGMSGVRWATTYTNANGIEMVGVADWMRKTKSRALAIPLYGLWNGTGENAKPSMWQLRLDNPRPRPEDWEQSEEKVVKFEQPIGVERGPMHGQLVADVHPTRLTDATNPTISLIITEGQAKGDALLSAASDCCIDVVVTTLTGVTMAFHKADDEGGERHLSKAMLALKGDDGDGFMGRDVFLCWDADWRTNKMVSGSMMATGRLLEAEGATVHVIDLPGSGKDGADDYLAVHGSAALLGLMDSALALAEVDPQSRRKHELNPEASGNKGYLPWTVSHAAWEFMHSPHADLLIRQGQFWWAWTGQQWVFSKSDDHARRVLLDWTTTVKTPFVTETDDDGKVTRKVAPGFGKWMYLLQSPRGQRDVLAMLAGHPRLARPILDMDHRYGHELNTPSGMLDLRTGEVLPHDPLHCHSKMAPVSAVAGPTPVWDRFLRTSFPDPEVREFIQDLIVTWLHGDVVHEDFTIMVGSEGGSGKGVLAELMQAILGDGYAVVPPKPWLMASQADTHESQLASLRGVRWAAQDELPVSLAKKFSDELNIALVKMLTGGNRVVARRMRQDNEDATSFLPTASICLLTNDMPTLAGSVASMLRRIRKLDFSVQFRPGDPDFDPELKAKLRDEAPAILASLTQRSVAYHHRGRELIVPASVAMSQSDYADESDTISYWLREHCTVEATDSHNHVKPGNAYDHYCAWTRESLSTPLGKHEFARQMRTKMTSGAIGTTSGDGAVKVTQVKTSGVVWANLKLGAFPAGYAAMYNHGG